MVITYDTSSGHHNLSLKLFYADDPSAIVKKNKFEEWDGLELKYMMRKLTKNFFCYISKKEFLNAQESLFIKSNPKLKNKSTIESV